VRRRIASLSSTSRRSAGWPDRATHFDFDERVTHVSALDGAELRAFDLPGDRAQLARRIKLRLNLAA
jgi:hypothetical protein